MKYLVHTFGHFEFYISSIILWQCLKVFDMGGGLFKWEVDLLDQLGRQNLGPW
jgi:hypothetical protein